MYSYAFVIDTKRNKAKSLLSSVHLADTMRRYRAIFCSEYIAAIGNAASRWICVCLSVRASGSVCSTVYLYIAMGIEHWAMSTFNQRWLIVNVIGIYVDWLEVIWIGNSCNGFLIGCIYRSIYHYVVFLSIYCSSNAKSNGTEFHSFFPLHFIQARQ